MTPAEISVVIPAINEVVVDCRRGSNRRFGRVRVRSSWSMEAVKTAPSKRARRAGATKIVRSLPGRGVQLNSGLVLVDASQQRRPLPARR